MYLNFWGPVLPFVYDKIEFKGVNLPNGLRVPTPLYGSEQLMGDKNLITYQFNLSFFCTKTIRETLDLDISKSIKLNEIHTYVAICASVEILCRNL